MTKYSFNQQSCPEHDSKLLLGVFGLNSRPVGPGIYPNYPLLFGTSGLSRPIDSNLAVSVCPVGVSRSVRAWLLGARLTSHGSHVGRLDSFGVVAATFCVV